MTCYYITIFSSETVANLLLEIDKILNILSSTFKVNIRFIRERLHTFISFLC